MSQTPLDGQQAALFPNQNLAASDNVPDWKTSYLEAQEAKGEVAESIADSATSPTVPLAQEWPDETGEEPAPSKPLKLQRCTHSECEKGLHCFRLTKKQTRNKKVGECRRCDEHPVDFARVKQRDISDYEYTRWAFTQEWIRAEYWSNEIDLKAVLYAKRKGMKALLAMVPQRIAKAIGKPVSNNAYDGRQTSWEGNPIHYAQHATATCCRKCMEIWHGIPLESEITPDQLAYFSTLVQRYLTERLKDKDVREHSVRVSPQKKAPEGSLSLNFASEEPENTTLESSDVL